ncbi:hemolysin family protein [Natronococcus wangiae]|uniref:hemolysin family protein n=1 Tax=Natronococcus wangiae TaxID=3068275 RepID=UPI00273E06BF|nr:hemolysin family protein [Natronococcus sp. AD5]
MSLPVYSIEASPRIPLIAISGEGLLSETSITLIGIAVLIILLALSAFFSSSEIALFSLAKHRVNALVENGTPGAETVADLKSDPHRLLVTILVGNNLVNIGMSSISTAIVGFYFNTGTAVLISTFGITAIVLLFGESAPKSYAVEHTESWALRIAQPLKLSEYVLFPLVVIFDYLTRLVNKVTGGGAAIESSYVTRDEIQEMIRTGEREGVIEEDEWEMFQRIFRFRNTIAKEVMTPRLDIVGIDTEATLNEAITRCLESGHRRLPVYADTLDNIVGTADIHELIEAQWSGSAGNTRLGELELLAPPHHVPESKSVDELLGEMQTSRTQMAVVIDEFGTTEGLVTVEDLTEEIVGEILEGTEEAPITHLNETTALVRGDVDIAAVNEELDLNLPDGEEFETIAGLLFNRAGRLVEQGETFDCNDVQLQVETVDQTRVIQVRIRIDPSTETSETTTESIN